MAASSRKASTIVRAIVGLEQSLPVRLTGIGLQVTGDLSLAEWEQVFSVLENLASAAKWGRGDALNLCERQHGEKYAQFLRPDGKHSYSKLSNEKWVAKAIPPNRRLPTLSWSHHEAVAGLSTAAADSLLLWAQAGPGNGSTWPVSALRAIVREYRSAEEGRDPFDGYADPLAMPKTEYVTRRAEEITGGPIRPHMVSAILQAIHEYERAQAEDETRRTADARSDQGTEGDEALSGNARQDGQRDDGSAVRCLRE